MRVVVHDVYGPPADVLRVEPRPTPRPRDGEVLVAMEAAPIHPADLRRVAGDGPDRPRLPGAIPGTEAVGRVIARGDAVQGLDVGQRVLLPLRHGTWQDRVVVTPNRLVALPDNVEPTQAAMAQLVPATADLLLSRLVDLRPGEWLLQNAANGAVGQWIAALARRRGIRTLNIVRRPEAESAVRAAGGDVVLVDRGTAFGDDVRAYTGGAQIRLALDAVGGDLPQRMARCLVHGGTLVTYGSASGRPLTLDADALVCRDLRVRGFWLLDWLRNASAAERSALLARVLDEIASGTHQLPVVATYGLGQVAEAVAHAGQDRLRGRIVLTGEAWQP